MNSIRHMVYDVYFYGDHLDLAHALEFDIGLNVSGRAMMFGTECRMEGNKLWAVWDNPNSALGGYQGSMQGCCRQVESSGHQIQPPPAITW